MSDEDGSDEQDLERATVEWLAAVAEGSSPPTWVDLLQTRWRSQGDRNAMWSFVVRLGERADTGDSETMGMIGAGPLHDAIHSWPDAVLAAIDEEVARTPALLDALAIVIPENERVGERIEEILAHHGGKPTL